MIGLILTSLAGALAGWYTPGIFFKNTREIENLLDEESKKTTFKIWQK